MAPRFQPKGEESLVEKWILQKLNVAADATNAALLRRDFQGATMAVYNFWLYELCDVYIVRLLTLSSPPLYLTLAFGDRRRRSSSSRIQVPPRLLVCRRRTRFTLFWITVCGYYTPSCLSSPRSCGNDYRVVLQTRPRVSCSPSTPNRSVAYTSLKQVHDYSRGSV